MRGKPGTLLVSVASLHSGFSEGQRETSLETRKTHVLGRNSRYTWAAWVPDTISRVEESMLAPPLSSAGDLVAVNL